MLIAVADTHVVIWATIQPERLSRTAREFIERTARDGDQIAVSSISLAEVVYLTEQQRLPPDLFERLHGDLASSTSVFYEEAFDGRIARAMWSIRRDGVPDLPDRIIAATAYALGVPLITRDGRLRLSGLATVL